MARRGSKILLIVGVTLAINALLVVGLIYLNSAPTIEAEEPVSMQVKLVEQETPPPVPRPPSTEAPEPREAEPEPTEVAAMEPTPVVAEVEPIELDIDVKMPDAAPVRVMVSEPVAEPPPTPQPRPRPEPRRVPKKAAQPPTRPQPPAPPQRTGPIDATEADAAPRERAGNAAPSYPRSALRRHIEGYVDLRLRIDESGRVREVIVEDVVGHRNFEAAVMAVVRRWKFEPATLGGRAVEVWASKRIRFELSR